MKDIKKLRTEQSGIAHLGLIVVALLVFGVVGFGAYRVVQQNNSDEVGSVTQSNSKDESDTASAAQDEPDESDELKNVSTSEDQ